MLAISSKLKVNLDPDMPDVHLMKTSINEIEGQYMKKKSKLARTQNLFYLSITFSVMPKIH